MVVQFDEPSLPAALEGRLTGVTSLTPVHPVDESVAIGLLDDCVAAVGGEVMLHSCASGLPWKLLQRSAIHAVSIDVSTLAAADLDGVGEFVESGRTVMLGVVPSTAPDGPALRRGGGQISGEHHRPPRIPAFGAARPDRHHPGVWSGRGHAGVGAHRDRTGAEGRRRVRRRS